LPYWFTLLAEVYNIDNQISKCRLKIQEAFSVENATGEKWCHYRLLSLLTNR
jgi:hypothetical protein